MRYNLISLVLMTLVSVSLVKLEDVKARSNTWDVRLKERNKWEFSHQSEQKGVLKKKGEYYRMAFDGKEYKLKFKGNKLIITEVATKERIFSIKRKSEKYNIYFMGEVLFKLKRKSEKKVNIYKNGARIAKLKFAGNAVKVKDSSGKRLCKVKSPGMVLWPSVCAFAELKKDMQAVLLAGLIVVEQ